MITSIDTYIHKLIQESNTDKEVKKDKKQEKVKFDKKYGNNKVKFSNMPVQERGVPVNVDEEEEYVKPKKHLKRGK